METKGKNTPAAVAVLSAILKVSPALAYVMGRVMLRVCPFIRRA